MQKGGGEGVAGPNGILHLNCVAGHFRQVLAGQHYAALRAQRHTGRAPTAARRPIAAELRDRAAGDAAHPAHLGGFHVVQLHHIRQQHQLLDKRGRVRVAAEIDVVKPAGPRTRFQHAAGQRLRSGMGLVQRAVVNPVGLKAGNGVEVRHGELQLVIGGGAVNREAGLPGLIHLNGDDAGSDPGTLRMNSVESPSSRASSSARRPRSSSPTALRNRTSWPSRQACAAKLNDAPPSRSASG